MLSELINQIRTLSAEGHGIDYIAARVGVEMGDVQAVIANSAFATPTAVAGAAGLTPVVVGTLNTSDHDTPSIKVGQCAFYIASLVLDDVVTTLNSPVITSARGGFEPEMQFALISDSEGNGLIPAGALVLSVESAHSLTMNTNATGNGTGDYVALGGFVKLPPATFGAQVGIINADQHGGIVEVQTSSPDRIASKGTTNDVVLNWLDALFLIGDGQGMWQVMSNNPPFLLYPAGS